jgi:hypothetical protein
VNTRLIDHSIFAQQKNLRNCKKRMGDMRDANGGTLAQWRAAPVDVGDLPCNKFGNKYTRRLLMHDACSALASPDHEEPLAGPLADGVVVYRQRTCPLPDH